MTTRGIRLDGRSSGDAAPLASWKLKQALDRWPRASWRASDLGVMALSGNMFATGDPDRAPVRCTEPASYAHTAGEAAYAALTA